MSVNIVNQTTGDLTQVAGNATDKVGNLNALTTTDKSSCVGAINEVASDLTNYVKIDYAYLAANVTLQTGFIDLQFTPPTIEGYKPIGVTAFNLGDRALAASVYISGVDMRDNVAHIYGSVSQEVTITTAAHVSILYIRN